MSFGREKHRLTDWFKAKNSWFIDAEINYIIKKVWINICNPHNLLLKNPAKNVNKEKN